MCPIPSNKEYICLCNAKEIRKTRERKRIRRRRRHYIEIQWQFESTCILFRFSLSLWYRVRCQSWRKHSTGRKRTVHLIIGTCPSRREQVECVLLLFLSIAFLLPEECRAKTPYTGENCCCCFALLIVALNRLTEWCTHYCALTTLLFSPVSLLQGTKHTHTHMWRE